MKIYWLLVLLTAGDADRDPIRLFDTEAACTSEMYVYTHLMEFGGKPVCERTQYVTTLYKQPPS